MISAEDVGTHEDLVIFLREEFNVICSSRKEVRKVLAKIKFLDDGTGVTRFYHEIAVLMRDNRELVSFYLL